MVHVPYPKAPLSPAILFEFRTHLNLCDSAHLALWSAFLVGFFTLFRTANLVPRSLDTFSSHTALSRGSVSFPSCGAILTVTHKNSSLWRYCSHYSSSVHPRITSLSHVCFAQSALLLHTLSSHSQPPQTSKTASRPSLSTMASSV